MASDQVTPASTRHNLLTLPQELRDDIYLAVLQSPCEPPPSPDEAGQRAVWGIDPLWYGGTSVFYSVNLYPRYACQSMLVCNHQMNFEVRELLARYDTSQHGLDCKLDLMIRGAHVWPTWTLLPGPINHIRNLEVEMRIFDDYNGSQFLVDGGSGSIFRPLFHLLSDLFHHGPQFVYRGPFERQLHVDTMQFTIDVSKSSTEDDSIQLVWLKLRMMASVEGLSSRVSELKLNTSKGVRTFLVPDKELAQKGIKTLDY